MTVAAPRYLALIHRHIACFAVLSALGLASCSTAHQARQDTGAMFVGSPACRGCHQDIYNRWQSTLMANVVHDPKQDPSAIIGDFSTPNPLVTFRPEDVAFTYGSKWKQRYWKKPAMTRTAPHRTPC